MKVRFLIYLLIFKYTIFTNMSMYTKFLPSFFASKAFSLAKKKINNQKLETHFLIFNLSVTTNATYECHEICLFIYLLIWNGSRFEKESFRVSRVEPPGTLLSLLFTPSNALASTHNPVPIEIFLLSAIQPTNFPRNNKRKFSHFTPKGDTLSFQVGKISPKTFITMIMIILKLLSHLKQNKIVGRTFLGEEKRK